MKHARHFPWAAFALLLLLDVIVWLIEKKGVSNVGTGGTGFVVGVAQQPLIWIAIAVGPLQLWLWTRILGGSDLSLAYPLTSLSYPLTMICAQAFFGEHISGMVWMGAILITAGVALMGHHQPQTLDS